MSTSAAPVIEEFYEDQLEDLCASLLTERFLDAEVFPEITRSMKRREKDKYVFTKPDGSEITIYVEDTGLTSYRLHNRNKLNTDSIKKLFEALR